MLIAEMVKGLLVLLSAAVAAVAALPHPDAGRRRDMDSDLYMHVSERRVKREEPLYSDDENSADFWNKQAQLQLNAKISRKRNTNIARNVILFLGDGLSIPTYAASRIYKGQLENRTGEEEILSFENFPYAGLSRTYCIDSQVADSACSATAYLCGIKANRATIGVTGDVELDDCEASLNELNRVTSIGRWSQLRGKRTGVVTTTTVTHASPAGVYAQTAQRNWESDKELLSSGIDPAVCSDIARQLVYGETGRNLNVILGGGRQNFLPRNVTGEDGKSGSRVDGENLIHTWLNQKAARKQTAQYVSNRNELLNVSPDTDFLLGLFSASHLPYHLDSDEETDPTLADLTEAAINNLIKGPKGFFLFVEGGRIDHAHHANLGKKSLDETVEFEKAIQRAADLTDEQDTLIVVTSDHSHTLTISGYPERGNDILGIVELGSDGLPYSTLSYANGPGYRKDVGGKRHDLSQDDMDDDEYLFPATVPLSSETHGGDDVGIFARGPWAHLFTGSNQQNLIPHAMAYASCVGDGVTVCDHKLGLL